ncbi:hypothetical protein ABTL88_19455, partial [Acinetobacter baumannii]
GGFVVQAAYVGRRGTRRFRSYDINQIDAAPILSSFLIMRDNLNKGCQPNGTGCPAGVTGVTPPIASVPGITASFLNGS